MGCGVSSFRKYSVATCTSKPVIPLAIYLGLEGSSYQISKNYWQQTDRHTDYLTLCVHVDKQG